MKNLALKARTAADIGGQVDKVLRGIGYPEPPMDLRLARDLLKLDRGYYSTTDDSLLKETFNRLKVAGQQVLQRPTLLAEAVRTLSLKALYLPDHRRILIDEDLPPLKHRWNEAHEIGHDIIPWHAGMLLGDTESTLSPACHAAMESEANYAAGQLLFLGRRFIDEAMEVQPSLVEVKGLSQRFANTMTSTLWRYVEQGHGGRPIVALVSGHPHRSRRASDFTLTDPCRYCVQSPAFARRFGSLTETQLFVVASSYCGAQRGGLLGQAERLLTDSNGEPHVFHFETFFNRYEALTLAYWLRARPSAVAVSAVS